MSAFDQIGLDGILPNPEQPRVIFDEVDLQALADSIAQNGVIQPIVVEATADSGTFILHDGHRRVLASRKAGKTTIPAVICPAAAHNDQSRLVRAMVANVQRTDLTAIEEARGYARLRDQFGMSQKAVSQATGVSYARVSNRLDLLELPQPIQDMLAEGIMPTDLRVVRAVASIPDIETQMALVKRAHQAGMGNNAIIQAARSMSKGRPAAADKAQSFSANVVPALSVSNAHKASPKQWNALAQAGQIPPWPVLVTAAKQTCNKCSLISMASPETCRSCPFPQAIALMVKAAAEGGQ